MSARAELQADIEGALPAGALVVPNLRELGDPSPEVPVIVQLFRTNIAPTEHEHGRFVQKFEIWVLTPQTDPELLEDDLDDHVDTLSELFSGSDVYLWPAGFTRARHRSGRQGYRLPELTITSTATS